MKRKAIRIISILLAAVFVFAGCGEKAPAVKEGNTAEPTKQTESTEDKATTQKKDEAQSSSEKSEEVSSGKPSESVPSDSEKHVVVLDPGHGGGFSGAVSGSLVEKELSLNIAKKVKAYFEDNYPNIEVYLTREKDTALSGDVAVDLEERCEYAKSLGADILVSLHLNASEKHESDGANIYISHREHVTTQARELGEKILGELVALGLKNGGVHTRNSNDLFDEEGKVLDYYAINRHCAARDIPGIIVEHCFIDNAKDQAYLDSEEDLEKLAAADAEGIAAFFYGE